MEYRKDKIPMRIWFNHWFSTAYHLINMIKLDSSEEYSFIGTSTNPSAIYKTVCNEWCDEPKEITAPEYINFCTAFCIRHNIDIFVPRRYLTEIINNKEKFSKLGVKLFANTNPELVEILDDKQKTYDFFEERIPEIVPVFKIAHSYNEFCEYYEEVAKTGSRVCYKLIEDEGARSFRVIDNSIETIDSLLIKPGMKITLNAAKSIISQYNFIIPILLMPYLSGVEISVDCLYNKEKNLIIPRYKTNKRYSEIILNDEVIGLCDKILYFLNEDKPTMNMPMNIQFKKEHGKLYLLEINPRMSGGLQLSCKATNINLPSVAMRKLLNKEVSWEYPKDFMPRKVAHIETPIVIN